jgi:UrcA family protein
MKELMKNSKRIGLLVLLAMCVPAFGLAAAPGQAVEEVQMKVSFADLDLNHEAGIGRLYLRMRSAASGACGVSTLREAGSLKAVRVSQECYKELLDKAVLQVDNAALTKRHFG